MSWTARSDLARAAEAILVDEASFDGATPPLVAAQAVDLQQVAAVLSDLSGRPVRRVVVDDEDFVAGLVAGGTPEPVARFFLGTYHAARGGEFAVSDPTLETLIGRPPTTVQDALAQRNVAGAVR